MSPDANIYFVGLMGAGKTTVARQLAKRAQREFLDTDHEIERRTGVRVPVIFEIEGEQGFRDRETKLLTELSQQQGKVIATGGGIVVRAENRKLLRSSGVVVYLAAEPELLYERTRRDGNRPLLKVDDPLQRLRELYAERDPLYREVASVIVVTQQGSVAAQVKRIEAELAQCAH